jgi:hypothetical protein
VVSLFTAARRLPFRAHGGPIDLHERPKHRPFAALAAAPVEQQSIRDDGLTTPDGVIHLGDPVQRLALLPATPSVPEEGESGLGHRERVSDPQSYSGPVRHRPRRLPPPQLRPLAGDLHPVLGGKPHPRPSGLRQSDPVDEPLAAQLGQSAPGLLDPHLRAEDEVHLLGGRHPVLGEHRQRHPVTAARVHVRHRWSAFSIRCGTVLHGTACTSQISRCPRPHHQPRRPHHGHEATTPP